MAWVVRQLFSDPLHLFQSNMYWPMQGSLAATESLIPQALMVAPLLLWGADPLLAHNLSVAATFPLAGLGAYLLARDLSASPGGSFIAGLAYAFNAFRWEHFIQVGVLSAEWLPLALLFLRRSLRSPARHNLVGLAATSVLQVLSSGYYAVLLAVALAAALAAQPRKVLDPTRGLPILASLAVAVIVAVPAGLPYLALKERAEIRRTDHELAHWSARWKSYLDAGGYAAWTHLETLDTWAGEREPLYPGTIPAVLAIAGTAGLRRREGARFAVVMASTGLLVSLGPTISIGTAQVPGPFALLRELAIVQMIRVPSRFGVLALLGIGLLAALGWSLLATVRFRIPLLLAVSLLTVSEAYPAGLGARMEEIERAPPAVRLLSSVERGPVLELPWSDSAKYLYWSTVHWQPMVNGHGTFEPQTGNFGLALVGARFTRPYSSRVLRAAGVRWVVVHTDRLPAGGRRRVLAAAPLPKGVELIADFGDDRVYRIGPGPVAVWEPRLTE
jgi:hypothetical protein